MFHDPFLAKLSAFSGQLSARTALAAFPAES